MPRLFSAFLPSERAREDLARRMAVASAAAPEVRWVPAERWHVTLGFFGDDDDARRRSRWLSRRTAGLPAPTVRLAGSGLFSDLLWVGVEPAEDKDTAALARIAKAGGAGRRGFRAHVTVARRRSAPIARAALRELLAGYAGPWFTPTDIVLMRSDLGAAAPVYSVVTSVPLAFCQGV